MQKHHKKYAMQVEDVFVSFSLLCLHFDSPQLDFSILKDQLAKKDSFLKYFMTIV